MVRMQGDKHPAEAGMGSNRIKMITEFIITVIFLSISVINEYGFFILVAVNRSLILSSLDIIY